MKKLWFRRKLFGWGWYPSSWEGWVVTAVYLVLIFSFAATIDENSPFSEVMFTFILPLILITLAFIRIAYKTGEKPKWQWGKQKENK